MRGSRALRRGVARLTGVLVLCCALAVALGSAPGPISAEAEAKVPRNAVKKLRKAPCPPRYAVRVARNIDPESAALAKRGIFRIAGEKVKISRKMNWRYDPVGSPQFRARLHDLRWLDVLLHSYRTDGDRSALKRAKRIVVDWVKQNPLAAPSTDRTWFDKVVGDRAPYIAYVVRAAKCERLLRNKRLSRKLLGSIDQHTDFLAESENYSHSNRGLFMDLGLLLSGRQARFLPQANRKKKLGQRRFLRTVDSLTDYDEAFWQENSTTYQFLVINVLERFLEVSKRERPALEGLLENMRQTSAWLIEPDRRWLQAGDSFQDSTRFARQLAKNKRGLKVFPKSGLGFVRKGKKYLALLSDFGLPNHKHSDDLSFDLYEKGARLISDTGIPSKDPGRQYEFSRSARAHSVLTVDGLDFPRDAAASYGSGIRAWGKGDGWFAIEAVNPLVAPLGVDHSRVLLYRPGFALVVADRVRSATPHSYRRYLHFGPDWNLDFLPEKLLLKEAGAEVSVFSDSTDPEETRRVARGRSEPLQGFVWTGFRERDRRWSAWFSNETADLDAVVTVALKKRREARAVAVDPLGDATDVFEIAESGEPARTVTITRPAPGRLEISQEKSQYEPVPGLPSPYED